jgi:GNAT superfamily N-acetyltransferase
VAAPRVEVVKLKDVVAFAESASAEGGVSPVSLSRARAWTRNPLATPEDVVLVVGRVDGRAVGYLGLMPGLARVGDRTERMVWTSGLYADPAHRDSGVASLVLMKALTLGLSIGSSNASAVARRTLEPLRFASLGPLPHLVFDAARVNYAGFPLRALGRQARAAVVRPALGALNEALRVASREVALRALLAALPRRAYLEARAVPDLPDDILGAADRERPPVRMVRGPATLRWMLRDPWLTTDPASDAPSYYFSDLREHFEFRLLELVRASDGAPRGFAILRLMRDRGRSSVTLLDHHLVDPGEADALLAVVLAQALAYRADQVVVSYDCAGPVARSSVLSAGFRQEFRPFDLRPSARSALGAVLDRVHLDLADGDSSFA